jgi:leucyl aminopeptidase
MRFSYHTASITQVKTDVVVVCIHQDTELYDREMKALAAHFGAPVATLLSSGDFKAKEGETALLYLDAGANTRRLLLAGLGKKPTDTVTTLERYRRAAGTAAKRARSMKASTVALALPSAEDNAADVALALTEGAGLGLYRFEKHKSKSEDDSHTIEQLTVFSDDRKRQRVMAEAVRKGEILVAATSLARDLANAPGNEIYPETLAQAAVEAGKRSGFSVKVMTEGQIARLGMGGIIGVAKGSAHPPRFIMLEYGQKSKNPIVLVGKGVTFDTGGISLKPSANMSEMKMDMSGAAAVIGAFQAAARLALPVHIIGLIPAVENMPSGTSTRPGDILRHYNGKTSEVDNTDAEGRLILADALAYAERYHPAAVIDLATLTGACVVALGHFATGMMGNDDALMEKLKASGERTYERVWPLPLFDEYEKLIKSDVADVKNTGGRWAGAITAAWFLKKFIGNYPWVHLDIAGTAILEEHGAYTQKGASGVGVRLLADFLAHWKR